MISDEKVKIQIELSRFHIGRAFMPSAYQGGGYYTRRCVVCSWEADVWVGYGREPNPKPHDCPIGKLISEIGPVY